MAKYKVNITDDIFEFVDADSENDARLKVKALIAGGAASPFYDKLNFDYETGVSGKFVTEDGELKNLRAKLARAETPREQETVLESFVGSTGFTRNTKGQLALTPTGLEDLGLPVQRRRLADGTDIPLNTIIDENDFNLRTGDLADFAGLTGPIVGAIAMMSPHLRVIKGLTSLFGGRARLARVIAAGSGSATGKAAEEALDYQEGFQLQERDELRDLFGQEFLFGTVGQGIGELFGMGYRLMLGRNAPTEDLRLNRQMAKGRSASDILKLDAKLGREASEREIKKAVRDGLVSQFVFKGIASQATLGAKLPGRLQDISEQVLGNTRDKETAAYLRAEINNLLEEIGGENALLQKSINDSTKGLLDEQVQNSFQALRSKETEVTQKLVKLLDDVVDDLIEVGNYQDAPGRAAIGETLKQQLSRARSEVIRDLGDKYTKVDNAFAELTSLEGKVPGSAEYLAAENIDIVIRNTIVKGIKDSKKIIQQHKDSDYLWGVNNRPELDAGIVKKIEDALDEFLIQAQKPLTDPTRKEVGLRQVRNAYSKLNTIMRETVEASPERKAVIEIMRKFDDARVTGRGLDYSLPDGGPDSILTELATVGEDAFNKMVAANLRKANIGDEAITLQKEAQDLIRGSIEALRDTNRIAARRMAPFDRVHIKKTISNATNGAHNADEVYKNVILNGQDADLEAVFQALRNYDKLKGQAGKITNTENTLKAQLQKRLFADAFRAATNVVDDTIDFTTFAKEIKRFERDYPGKLNTLFRDKDGKSTGDLVRLTIDQINKISPRLKPQDVKDLVADLLRKEAGLTASGSANGLKFVQGLKELAEASDKVLRRKANRAINDLPLKGIDETVNTIFRPRARENIELLKETVSPEVFTAIQQASMQKLLAKSIDFNGKGRITDLFKPQNLKTALDSYTDETLEAMFGKELSQGLRNFQRQIDTLTKQEAGRGGAAGGLVAAGIGASLALNPIAVLPTALSLAVARKLFASPRFVAAIAKTDKGAIVTSLDMTEQAIRQTLIREMGIENDEATSLASDIMDGIYDEATLEELIESLQQTAEEVVTGAEDLTQETRQQLRTTQAPRTNIPLPDIEGVQMPTLDPVSRDRVEFDEQLFGRPSRIA